MMLKKRRSNYAAFRVVRIPTYYMKIAELNILRSITYRLTNDVIRIHCGESIDHISDQHVLYAKRPKLLMWFLEKLNHEIVKAGYRPHQNNAIESLNGLRSLPISESLPPDDFELAKDVIWTVNRTSERFGLRKNALPISYADLVKSQLGHSFTDSEIETCFDSENKIHYRSEMDWIYLNVRVFKNADQ